MAILLPTTSNGSEAGPVVACVATFVDEVRKYLQRYGIEDATQKTVELVESELPLGSEVSFSVEGEGESDELWLVAHLTIHAPSAEVFDMFNRFVDKWIEFIPKSGRQRMNLTYTAR